MTPNTKVGLVVGLFFIIGIGMLLSHQVQTGSSSPGRELSQLVPAKVEPTPAPTGTPRASGGAHLTAVRETHATGGPAGTTDVMRRVPLTPVATPPPVPGGTDVAVAPVALPAGWSTYKVQAGDHLTTISQKFYKTTRKYNAIYEANKDQLSSPDVVRAGMDLRIPPMPGGAPATGGPVVAVAPATPAATAAPVAPVPPAAPTPPPASPVLVPPPGSPTLLTPSTGTVAGTPTVGSPMVPPPSSVPPTLAAPPTSSALVPPGGSTVRPTNPLDSTALVPVEPSRVPMITIPAGPGSSGGATAMYRTKEGDTLSSIAGELMGDSGQWKTLYEANKNVISDPDILPVGVVLKVPQPRVALGQ